MPLSAIVQLHMWFPLRRVRPAGRVLLQPLEPARRPRGRALPDADLLSGRQDARAQEQVRLAGGAGHHGRIGRGALGRAAPQDPRRHSHHL